MNEPNGCPAALKGDHQMYEEDRWAELRSKNDGAQSDQLIPPQSVNDVMKKNLTEDMLVAEQIDEKKGIKNRAKSLIKIEVEKEICRPKTGKSLPRDNDDLKSLNLIQLQDEID